MLRKFKHQVPLFLKNRHECQFRFNIQNHFSALSWKSESKFSGVGHHSEVKLVAFFEIDHKDFLTHWLHLVNPFGLMKPILRTKELETCIYFSCRRNPKKFSVLVGVVSMKRVRRNNRFKVSSVRLHAGYSLKTLTDSRKFGVGWT